MKTHFVKILSLVPGIAGLICTMGNLRAAEIQGVSIYNFSAQDYVYPSTATYSVTNLVTSAGLYGDQHAFVPQGCMWLVSNAGMPGTNFVTFNLGGLYTVNSIKVWNYNDSTFISGATGRINFGVSNASIAYSTDGINFTTSIASQNFTMGHGNFTPYAQMITLPSPVSAQYIRFNINTNNSQGTNGVDLAKVRFISNTNPPSILTATENFGSNQVTVVYSETVDPTSSLNPANYSVSGATISSVTAGEYADRVILQTSPLTGSHTLNVSGVYDEALTCAVTNSAAVTSEVYLWLRADQGVTDATANGVNNMVTGWADQSPYGHNAQSASFFGTLTNGPSLVNNAVNGLPALQFFGTNVLQIPNDAANPINGDMTLFVVFSSASSTLGQDLISKTGGGSSATTTNNLAAPWDFQFAANSVKPTFNWGNNGVNANNITPGQALSANTFYVAALSVTGTNLGQLIVNGSLPLSDITQTPNNRMSAYELFGGAPQDAGNPITIGGRNSGGATLGNANPFIGYLPEAILIRGTITPGDLASIENYLAKKYAIAPVSITEQPASLTANAGTRATFWAGTSGMQPFIYQWQSNGVAIAGATNLSYTTPYLASSASGTSYTVAITNASGSVVSSPATLTVVTPTTGPTVYSAAKSTSLTSVLVVFSEAVDPVTSQNAANYFINGGVSVSSVAAGSSANQVVLTVSGMNANSLYQIQVQNVQDQYGNTMVPAKQPVMPASLTMWLRADSGVVTNTATGSTVDAWLDQTANGNNAVTYGIGPSYRPSLGTDLVNGKPAVFFNQGSPDYFWVPGSVGLNIPGDMSFYDVFNVPEYGSNYRSLISQADAITTLANSYDLYLVKGATSGQVKWGRGDGTSYHTGTLTGPNMYTYQGAPVTFNMVHQGAGIQPAVGGNGFWWVNGGNAASGSTAFTTATLADFGGLVSIGVRGSFDLPMSGDVLNEMVFSNAISGFDRTNIDNYLGFADFFVTNTLPLNNVTNNAGNMQTFVVSASQGSAHLVYQWVENGTNINGANGSAYTTGPLFAGDNGDTFSVSVIDPAWSTNVIGPVTLTVISVPPVVTYYGTPIWTSNTIIVTFQEGVNPSTATNLAKLCLEPQRHDSIRNDVGTQPGAFDDDAA